MPRPRLAPTLLLTAAAACMAPRPPAPPPPPDAPAGVAAPPIPIAEARRLPLGASVTVEGGVNLASGEIDAGFGMEDETGGIYVAADSGTVLPTSTHVRVTGRLTDNHGLLTIAPAGIVELGRRPTSARPMKTGEVGEANEGLRVYVEAPVAAPPVDDMPYGWKITVDDGSGPLLVFVPPRHNLVLRCIRPGQVLQTHGLSGQYDDHHELVAAVLTIDGRMWNPDHPPDTCPDGR